MDSERERKREKEQTKERKKKINAKSAKISVNSDRFQLSTSIL